MNRNRLGECQKSRQACNGTYHLLTLSLGHNNLTQLPLIVVCTKSLTYLNIAWKLFQTLPNLVSMGIAISFIRKEQLIVGFNPFNCGCSVLWVKKWQHECEQKGPRCAIDRYPKQPWCNSGPFRGRSWRNLTLYDITMYCSFTTTG